MKLKILFLGDSNSPVYSWLKKTEKYVACETGVLTPNYIAKNNFNYLISYGYKHIIKKEILDLFNNKCINLHISYLPHNRGVDPNFWSFINKTPKGVTIHFIDENIDTGNIIVQKEVFFDDLASQTLASTYEILQCEIQKLFYQNWNKIKENKIQSIPQPKKGSFHLYKDKDSLLYLIKKEGWNTKITDILKKIN
tara:strand:+ start:313 stop:897 length:585 start_codon:yes stop_codon:yes gene_type:complete